MPPKRTRRAAGIGLVLLLVAVWPANVRMLIDARASQEPRWCLALQVVLIAWIRRASQRRRAA